MAEGGVVVQGDLGVEGVHPTIGGKDERVDLDQVGVALGKAAVKAQQHLGRLRPGLLVKLRFGHQLVRLSLAEADVRVDVEADYSVRVVRRHLFYLYPALGGHHGQVVLGPPVEGEAGVVLALDVGSVLDPDPAYDVPTDVHAEDRRGVGPGLLGVPRQFDPTGLAPAPDLYLGLHHHRVAEPFSELNDFVRGGGDASGRDGDTKTGEVLLALVFEEVHSRSLPGFRPHKTTGASRGLRDSTPVPLTCQNRAPSRARRKAGPRAVQGLRPARGYCRYCRR